jgi:hypothetical protein
MEIWRENGSYILLSKDEVEKSSIKTYRSANK